MRPGPRVSFIGTPYDDRGEFLEWLAAQGFGLPVTMSGGLVVEAALSAQAVAGMYRGRGAVSATVSRGIWRSKINLSFLTIPNQDEFVHKSFEIAACEGFLLAERSEGHLQRFREDEEAVYFSTIEECGEDSAAICRTRRRKPDRRGGHGRGGTQRDTTTTPKLG
jgi:spore maturation protein CgeB